MRAPPDTAVAASAGRQVPPPPPPPPPPAPSPRLAPGLPNELLLAVFARAPTAALLACRLASRRARTLAELVLVARMATAAVDLAAQLAAADQDFRLAEREKRPLLRHYKGFLRNGGLGPRDLAEAVGYSVPPDELKTVCECLCILKNGAPVPASPPSPPLSPEPSGKSSSLAVLAAGDLHASASEPAADSIPSDSTYDPMTWPKIKLQMCTTDFKAWLSNLRVGVDHLSPLSVKRVERIIMLDPSITYERLRDASTAGYKVLIVVAACLQYGNISEDLRARRRRAVLLERRRSRIVAFITGIEAQARAQEAVGAAAGQAALYDTIESLLEETAFLQGSPSIPPRAQ